MNRHVFRTMIVLATVSLLGIVITQIYWVRKASQERAEQFERGVTLALSSVARTLRHGQSQDWELLNPIRQVERNYYIVMVNEPIDNNELEFALRHEFGLRGVLTDFEYALYDCETEQLVYGDYVQLNDRTGPPVEKVVWHDIKKKAHYFAVFFHQRQGQSFSEMGIWVFSSVVVSFVVFFFAYSLFVMLRQKRLSEVQKDFINTMTHEFKTPISTISLSGEALLMPHVSATPDRVGRYATIILQESSRLRQQVERVLQVARNDRSSLSLTVESIPIAELLDEVRMALEDKILECGAQLRIDLTPGPFTIEGDRLHLLNVLINLVENSLKYAGAQPQIILYAHQRRQQIALGVVDDGPGIPPADQGRIFQRFYRAHRANTDRQGFGLGLFYVRLVAEAHGGRVRVTRGPLPGACIELILDARLNGYRRKWRRLVRGFTLSDD